jgi:DNA replication protein DnaC
MTMTKKPAPGARPKKVAPDEPRTPYERVKALGLWGLLSAFEEVEGEPWVERLLDIEERERHRRSLERRLKNARIGRFKPMVDFEWGWPKKIERTAIDEALRLDFMKEGANVILLGPNGVGKTMIAQNIAHEAILSGKTVRMTTASELLCDLAAQEGTTALLRRIRRYANPSLLVIDELGYLSSTARHGDLLFEVVTRRYQEQRPIVITTNKPFSEWNQVFPSAGCVVTLVDRLVHRSEIIVIEGESYRHKEAQERSHRKAKSRGKVPSGS